MPLTVKHSKVSAIPDDPVAVAAGEVVPSHWNADHPVTGTLDVANGGTGQATANAALNALLPSQASQSGKFLSTNGTDASWAAPSGASAITISNKTGAYTVVSGDLGTIINCTSGTFTVALTAAATLGSGFHCWIWNTGDGTVTIDPAGVETIDGTGTTYILRPRAGVRIVCNGTGWLTGDNKALRLYQESNPNDGNFTRPIANGFSSFAIGSAANASAQNSAAIGNSSSASALGAIAIGFSQATAQSALCINGASGLSLAQARSTNSTALGSNSASQGSYTTTGAGAVAIGGSYATGADSLAAVSVDNTSTYGTNVLGAIAVGKQSKSSGASGVALGELANVSGNYGLAFGYDCLSSQVAAVTFGYKARSSIIGKYAYASGSFAVSGDAQISVFVSRAVTTDATATLLTTNGGLASSINQIVLANSTAYSFSGIVVARQQAAGGTQSAAWKIEGLIRREANAASTTLVASTVTAISNAPGWTLALSADTGNGGLALTATGAAATNIRWVANVQVSEVTYA